MNKNKSLNIPNRKIKTVVNMMFDDIPYSEEVDEAQGKIISALNEEFDKIKEGKHDDEALEELLAKYGRLSQMAKLAGYPSDIAAKWRESGEAVNAEPLKKELRKQRTRTYLTSAFCVFALIQVTGLAYNLIALNFLSVIGNLIFLVADVFILSIPLRKIVSVEKTAKNKRYDIDAYKFLREQTDKYSKKVINSIALLFGVLFIFFFSELSFFIFGNSKWAELSENLYKNSILVEIPVFILFKNVILSKLFQKRINIPDKKKFKKHIIGICAFSAGYWIGVTVLTVLLSSSLTYPGNVFVVTGVVYAVLILIYDLTIRKKITFKNIVIHKARAAVCIIAVIAIGGMAFLQRDTWYTQNYINSVPLVEHNNNKIEYNDKTGVYTITSAAKDFKILHLTDIHIGGSLYSYRKDLKALKACYAEIEHTHPDLVLVTGDMSFPLGIISLSLNNTSPVGQFAAFMRNTGIPWAFTYGNHDTEPLSSATQEQLEDVYKSLSFKTSGNLLYPYTQPDIMGRNNQLIEVRNSDGSLNTGLFMIDSNAYTGEGINVYDYIHDDQVDWYAEQVNRMKKEAGHTVNSMVFFHIPLREYLTATNLYDEGSSEVKYFFGENPGDHGGITNFKVCCSDYESKLFDTAYKLGSTTGFFCGHDHYNNASLEYKGIRLTYGMSIDYLAMPGIEKETKQRGAELITLHSDSTWDLEQIPLTSIT